MEYTSDILLIYRHPPNQNAPTILEHVESFEKYSSYTIIKINSEFGFPIGLELYNFRVIILHYSLFGSYPFSISEKFLDFISESTKSFKIAFFQDEYQYCQERYKIINRLGIDLIYSLLNAEYFNKIYLTNTNVREVKNTLTGYVCDSLVDKGKKYSKTFKDRSIDVGYRARNLPYHYGRGAREKAEIADKFIDAVKVKASHLKLDISTKEQDRIYGNNWYKFISNCKFMLGVMAGTSIFDINGHIKKLVENYLKKHPNSSFEDVESSILLLYEEKINYRTISPRIFECSALRTCMILYRDTYQGIVNPYEHYIPLNKDFSNIDSVFEKMMDQRYVNKLLDRSYIDLIESNKYHYRKFIKEIDNKLHSLGCTISNNKNDNKHLINIIEKHKKLI